MAHHYSNRLSGWSSLESSYQDQDCYNTHQQQTYLGEPMCIEAPGPQGYPQPQPHQHSGQGIPSWKPSTDQMRRFYDEQDQFSHLASQVHYPFLPTERGVQGVHPLPNPPSYEAPRPPSTCSSGMRSPVTMDDPVSPTTPQDSLFWEHHQLIQHSGASENEFVNPTLVHSSPETENIVDPAQVTCFQTLYDPQGALAFDPAITGSELSMLPPPGIIPHNAMSPVSTAPDILDSITAAPTELPQSLSPEISDLESGSRDPTPHYGDEESNYEESHGTEGDNQARLPQSPESKKRSGTSLLEPSMKKARRNTSKDTPPFRCVFHFAGCKKLFPSKNEWKRHTLSQHIFLNFWHCTEHSCLETFRHTGGSIFNRKDLYTQHIRRMHVPTKYQKQIKNKKPVPEWEAQLRRMQEVAIKKRCELPTYMRCPAQGCDAEFNGSTAWDDRMEHVARHLEKAATGEEPEVKFGGPEDCTLTDWAALPEINVLRQSNGKWQLVKPMNTTAAAGGGGRQSSRQLEREYNDSEDGEGEPDTD